ncbi:MAG: sigma-54-dependent Fis family transcriptional regulator [Myxococcales bacterium]|nr:sigma-54-dependent Fis family transcriptional regulator [Myxococcales bacterium]
MASILVVDDEKSIRAAQAVGLRRAGFEVDTAATGEEAVAMVRDGSYDLVLSDVRLQGMDGMEVLRAVRSASPGTQVVLMTGFGTIEDAVSAMQLGAHSYVRKPSEAADVEQIVRQCLADATPAPTPPRAAAPTSRRDSFAGIIGESRPMRELLELVTKVADTDSTVLITGETGTGKELVGRAIHNASRRVDRVFSAVNSAAFPETLLESELFGHRRGAFTGASNNKKGLFEHAHQGTVFLDEVAEMPLSMQAKLLRFLQTGEIRPVGGEATRLVDVRLVTATNKDLEQEVARGNFREDLYYRLAVIPVHVAPLRQRIDDVPLLARHFLASFARKIGKDVKGVADDAMQALCGYDWPGNVRELENSIERAVALCRGDRVVRQDLPNRILERRVELPAAGIQSLRTLERTHIIDTLEKVGWNRKRAAELLNISTTTLWRRLKEFGIDGSAPQARSGGAPQARP